MFGSRLKDLRNERKLTQDDLGKLLNVSGKTIGTWERDSRQPNIESINKLATIFGVTTDYLLGNSDEKKSQKYYELSDKEKNDIAIQAERLMEGIESGHNLNFYGEPATKEQKDRILIAVKTAMEMNKMEAKRKFTPKKHRD
ncbi:helix-turn-helix domain-containing protein [Ligilactobacillus salivarius]|jgi:transcriptional regulator with XRE-family HTH domain|uniref:Helix-turn-helix domain-containing protein n=1 Tax=Ligilactobacillus salivarius TaxID=1624 RepID=A0ABD6JIJ0_9LACO|nr:helix-turn-helix transcriptional regulator [Ligilactobacillus salivarius]DAM78475.1 MAG TPA: helix-turn-helix domain protein [Caudoviricetes sp.]MYU71105.1 helix-turn-helix domain-containing protein [Ligilactobacillus salivarius]MYU96922.1 helix-turn-helix domain-containing protein [Ligilactobacillus salivarius]MYY23733.1 helix-turn-helix domain-containing protein [Ligilactobacillus salivarius]MYY40857.1 helix-turn-helix domain-containing protein [Ligilactobacillus salivarius]